MPLDIDPRWEYWMPSDPEVAEILDEARVLVGFEGLRDYRLDNDRWFGFRFGHGNPNYSHTHLAPPRRDGYTIPKEKRSIRCKYCGALFEPKRSDSQYCCKSHAVKHCTPGIPKTDRNRVMYDEYQKGNSSRFLGSKYGVTAQRVLQIVAKYALDNNLPLRTSSTKKVG